MGLGTLPYPAPAPPRTGSRAYSQSYSAPPATGSRAYSQVYPEWSDKYAQDTGFSAAAPGSSLPGGSNALSIVDQMGITSAVRGDQLFNQYTNGLGMAELGYNNNLWYKTASAGNDLAKLDLREGREVGIGKERIAADRGFADRAFGIDSRGNALTRDMGYRANDSEAAAKGSITSVGYGQNRRDILDQFGIAQDTTQLQFDKKNSDLTLDEKTLDSLAKEFDIQRSDVRNALQYGTSQLGLDWAQTQAQLRANLDSGNEELIQQSRNFMQGIMSMPMEGATASDIFPGGLPGMPGGSSASATNTPTTTSGKDYEGAGPYTITPATRDYTNRR